MCKNKELKEEIKSQENRHKDILLEKLKTYINEANSFAKLIVTISTFYAAFYFVQNLIFKFSCEKMYGIPAMYFSYNADHNIIVILDLILVIGMFFYPYSHKEDRKASKIDNITDWLYKFGTGLIIAFFCVSIYAGIIEKFTSKNNVFIDLIIMLLFIIIFICGISSIFVVFGKKHKHMGLSMLTVSVTIIVMILGVIHELNLLYREKSAYEFVKIEDEEYVILSKVDDKVLVVPFEYDQTGKCHIKTSQYSFKNKYDGTYYYVDLKNTPIIEK